MQQDDVILNMIMCFNIWLQKWVNWLFLRQFIWSGVVKVTWYNTSFTSSSVVLPASWPSNSSAGTLWAAKFDARDPSCPSNTPYKQTPSWLEMENSNSVKISNFLCIYLHYYIAQSKMEHSYKWFYLHIKILSRNT